MSDAIDSWTQGANNLTIHKVADHAHPCAGIVGAGASVIAPEDGNRSGVAFLSTMCTESFGSGVLAINVSYSTGSHYTNSDIIFNSAVNWDIHSGPILGSSVYDFKRIAVHELGHLLGLGHETTQTAIMNPAYTDPERIAAGDLNMETPTPDDYQGINTLYGAGSEVPPLKVVLEEPHSHGATVGVGNVRGWAVAKSGIAEVEIYIDGVFWDNAPYGASRADVGAQYPTYPNANNSGFSMINNWSNYTEGPHTIVARAIDKLGNVASTSGLAMVDKFDVSYISSADLVKLSDNISSSGDTITLDNVSINGKSYRIVLKWSNATQQFDIANIINLF
ncbi:MAG: matrixin family metalloprotease [Cellvibrionaceae bacterium]|nr:matrixin family metalloprotease [Cellvibrionaceae bacterium]